MNEDQEYLRAKKKVENLKSFYINLTAYISVNILLFVINYVTAKGDWWFIFPLVGWGIGVAIHGLVTYLDYNRSTANWEDRKIKELLERDKKNQ